MNIWENIAKCFGFYEPSSGFDIKEWIYIIYSDLKWRDLVYINLLNTAGHMLHQTFNLLNPTGHVIHQKFNLLNPTGYVMRQQFNLLKPTGYVMHQQFNL